MLTFYLVVPMVKLGAEMPMRVKKLCKAKSCNLPARVVSDRDRTYRARSCIATKNLCIEYCLDMNRTHLECRHLGT